ncbi:hypothetical protein G6F54_013655 [Rhizopus delemar]|nr:hypothetical protein G6F54_013655 [Rhizopus delemar]
MVTPFSLTAVTPATQFGDGGAQRLDRIVHAFAVRNGVFAQVVREVAHVVGHHVHRRERHQVIPAVQRAYAHGAYRHAFHGAEHASDLHHVVLVHAVLKLDEDACDDVLYQLLRAEADGQAHHAGAGDQRPPVDAPLRQQPHQPPAGCARARWACPVLPVGSSGVR